MWDGENVRPEKDTITPLFYTEKQGKTVTKLCRINGLKCFRPEILKENGRHVGKIIRSWGYHGEHFPITVGKHGFVWISLDKTLGKK